MEESERVKVDSATFIFSLSVMLRRDNLLKHGCVRKGYNTLIEVLSMDK